MITGVCLFCKKEFRKRGRGYKFCSVMCSNRFNLNGLNKVSLPEQSEKLAEFIGICLGDGSVSSYQTSVALNSIADKNYTPYVTTLINDLFPDAPFSIQKKKNENVVELRIHSRIVADFLKEMGIISNHKLIPQWIFQKHEYTKACIRGLFDTEGSISFKIYKRRDGQSLYKQLNFRNADIKLMRFIRDELTKIGLKPTMTLKRSLYLSNHESIKYFSEVIGFSNPKLIERSLICDINSYQKWLHLQFQITPETVLY